jgi:peroxiredoxin
MTNDTMTQHLTFLDEDGNEVTLEDWRGDRVLLVFMRWLG